MGFLDRFTHSWKAFNSYDEKKEIVTYATVGMGSSNPNYRIRTARYKQSDYTAAIFNRIAMDVSTIAIQHVKVDENNGDIKLMKSALNECLSVEANQDQSHLDFIRDMVYSMFDDGAIAVVPIDATEDPNITQSFDVGAMRVGRITQWYPKHVRVMLYNEETGNEEELLQTKRGVAIIENPLYAVINGPNATLKRLMAKIGQLDDIDAAIASGQLDLFIQLPYAVRSDLQKDQAKERIDAINEQIASSKRGIAYIDGTEKVTQLNRPVNNQLLDQINQLTKQFYNQLGLTEKVFDGTASESEMRNYYTRTIDPIVSVIMAEFIRKFLSKTARSQGQTLQAYRDPFKLVPIENIANIADTFRRNTILSSNELRKIVGFRPSNEPQADLLYNPNLTEEQQQSPTGSPTPPAKEPSK
ncbi:MAG: hypothetical protein [Caudoviricetes sp.]|nr:MAG: hypothetical protein [Caudoviricetes sp.]